MRISRAICAGLIEAGGPHDGQSQPSQFPAQFARALIEAAWPPARWRACAPISRAICAGLIEAVGAIVLHLRVM